jgi:hypothetical protein
MKRFFKKLAVLLALGVVSLYPASCFLGDSSPVDSTKIVVSDINIRGGVLAVVSGGSYDYGSVLTGQSSSAMFVIENLGRDYLVLNGTPFVDISGPDAALFTIDAQPATPIAPFSFRTFTITFTPGTAGAKTAVVTIASSDPDEASYSFTITAQAH